MVNKPLNHSKVGSQHSTSSGNQMVLSQTTCCCTRSVEHSSSIVCNCPCTMLGNQGGPLIYQCKGQGTDQIYFGTAGFLLAGDSSGDVLRRLADLCSGAADSSASRILCTYTQGKLMHIVSGIVKCLEKLVCANKCGQQLAAITAGCLPVRDFF